MPDLAPDELEGWGVGWRVALWGVLGLFVALALALGVMQLIWRGAGSPHVNTRPREVFPGPRLNARLDSDPHWSFAPPNPAESGPDPQLARAMARLAARGDAAYAPLAPPPAGVPRQTIGTPTPAAAAAGTGGRAESAQ